MKNIFEATIKDEIINRLNQLTVDSKRNWGKMTVTQMLAHLTRSIKIANGETKMKRAFLGRILSPLVKSLYYNDKPYPKNIKMGIEAYIPDESLFEEEKNKLTAIIQAFSGGGPAECTSHPHPFFGYLTPNQWGQAVYKHLDHHLRQFDE